MIILVEPIAFKDYSGWTNHIVGWLNCYVWRRLIGELKKIGEDWPFLKLNSDIENNL